MLQTLPAELLQIIAAYCDTRSLSNLNRICRRLFENTNEHLQNRHFSYTPTSYQLNKCRYFGMVKDNTTLPLNTIGDYAFYMYMDKTKDNCSAYACCWAANCIDTYQQRYVNCIATIRFIFKRGTISILSYGLVFNNNDDIDLTLPQLYYVLFNLEDDSSRILYLGKDFDMIQALFYCVRDMIGSSDDLPVDDVAVGRRFKRLPVRHVSVRNLGQHTTVSKTNLDTHGRDVLKQLTC
jgi:hypothetical protein